MLPNNQGEHSRHGIRPAGDPHLSLPGIRDIFGLEATDDLGTLVSQPNYSASPKPGSLRLNATSAAHSGSRSHLFVTDVPSPGSPASSRMSMSTHDYQHSRYEVASGGHSSLSPAYLPPGWAAYDAQTLASSPPSAHSLPPLSAALPHPGGRGRSLSEVANTRHASQNDRRAQRYDHHPSLTVLSQVRPSGLVSSSATTAGPADTEAPHRRAAIGDRGPANAPSFNAGAPHLPALSRHHSPTHAPFYESGRAMSPMPVAQPGRHLQAGAGSWYRQHPDVHDRPSSRSNESANSPLYHRQESLMRGTPHQSLSSPSSPRLYGRPVGRAHHVAPWTSSPSLQGHRPVSQTGTTGTTRRLHPSGSSSSLKGTQSSEETVTEDKSAGRYECEYCPKRFNRPSSLKIHVNKHTGAQPFQCPFPDCSRRFSVMSNMRRHARVHTNAVVDTPTEGERPTAGASGANPDTSSQDMPSSRGSGWRAGLTRTRGSISSRGRSSSCSGPGSPNDIDIEMEIAEERGSSSACSPSEPGRSAHSQPIAHIPPPGASSIPHVGSFHPSLP